MNQRKPIDKRENFSPCKRTHRIILKQPTAGISHRPKARRVGVFSSNQPSRFFIKPIFFFLSMKPIFILVMSMILCREEKLSQLSLSPSLSPDHSVEISSKIYNLHV
jgi:hypothetical protein